jgi:Pvc16 N-terminal domain
MSNFLAIATVTATLSQVLQTAVGVDVPGAAVSTVRPDSAGSGIPTTGVNLYLYQVAPCASLRNADLPTRSYNGQLVQRPQVALDLHYLLTFYGNEAQLEPQRLLGSVVRTLHARPVLTRQQIQKTLAPEEGPFKDLAGSNLAEGAELVKFSPLPLSLEELSKLWSVFFQTTYTLSIAYQGSVVLIESDDTPQAALPVRARNLYVVPFRQPVIERVMSQSGADQPIVADSTLVILGRQLRGDVTRVRFGGVEVTPQEVTDTQLSLRLAYRVCRLAMRC